MTLKLSYPAHLVGILFGAWLIFLLSLLTPALQRELIFLNRIHWPPNAQFDAPERYGLAPFKTRNLYLNASDGERIGAWHILPRKHYLSVEKGIPKRKLNDEIFDKAFGERPTVLYMHGNAGTRAVKHRVRNYMVYSDIFDCNVLAIDYRGFGDSSGMPSEFGLITDARAAWNFVSSKIGAHRQHGWSFSEKVRAEKEIILIGQSLGTGVVAGLSRQLAEEGESFSF
ncbi:hypothetical protein TREMEDRAFT_61846 [Tremella mesenterica DSM 1558]|uniref:uncharacterized protein n=1 Tax=Tremella mesenterica (strain ATCC 24925 / CBS 8224 / DSM 1558 / NBRC 9311 / NRRL Y-6157 / RJB 2259-6 / UBC 559-6) TaxID=578456 RepID=UPI0003F4A0F0|nr:uncharacterized protein TREMEDRAFT_61846 [Tremella mesenterica DSM 1558]EIW70086.1 hypothetical protein TREMEDRAFT_61846 [Tremella mesenterica DSM 1558]